MCVERGNYYEINLSFVINNCEEYFSNNESLLHTMKIGATAKTRLLLFLLKIKEKKRGYCHVSYCEFSSGSSPLSEASQKRSSEPKEIETVWPNPGRIGVLDIRKSAE